jgi:hypothetical protein
MNVFLYDVFVRTMSLEDTREALRDLIIELLAEWRWSASQERSDLARDILYRTDMLCKIDIHLPRSPGDE